MTSIHAETVAPGHDRGATPFMTMLAATMTYLHVAGEQDDLAISSLTAGRARPELDRLVGMFTNNLVLRAIAYQDFPYDVLMRRLHPAARTIPFGSVMFAHRHAFPSAVGGAAESRTIVADEGDAKFDLWFSVIEQGPERILRLVADSARYT